MPMPSALAAPLPARAPRVLTLLLVEDSRFASDAYRLICRRLGIRMRRADSIEAARSHLRTYLPDVVVVDLGLPDGRGEMLIRAMVVSPLRPALVLGTSGDEDGRPRALAAGADGYLAKPLQAAKHLLDVIDRHAPDLIPVLTHGLAGRMVEDGPVQPDPLAYHDDLAHAAAILADAAPAPRAGARRAYLGQFLGGLAEAGHDPQLSRAARNPAVEEAGLARLLDQRLVAGAPLGLPMGG